jgi:hypothetical protein
MIRKLTIYIHYNKPQTNAGNQCRKPWENYAFSFENDKYPDDKINIIGLFGNLQELTTNIENVQTTKYQDLSIIYSCREKSAVCSNAENRASHAMF